QPDEQDDAEDEPEAAALRHGPGERGRSLQHETLLAGAEAGARSQRGACRHFTALRRGGEPQSAFDAARGFARRRAKPRAAFLYFDARAAERIQVDRQVDRFYREHQSRTPPFGQVTRIMSNEPDPSQGTTETPPETRIQLPQ